MTFKKIAAMTDIHFGRKSDSEQHNQDCLDYVSWFCSNVRERKPDQIIVMGDWFDNRSRLRLDTQWRSREAFDMLNGLNLPIWFLIGNHDMYFRNNRSVHSHPYLDLFPGVRVINEPTLIGDILLCPYLVGEEFAVVPSYECKYVFGHFEFPMFLTNEWYEFEDKGHGITADMFTHPEWVFSGHFHKRQIKKNSHGVNICYIGNTFGMDYNDTNDRKRGAMFFEHGGVPEFLDWTAGPNYNRIKMSEVLEMDIEGFEKKFNSKSVIECTDDVNIPDEDLFVLNEYIQGMVREFTVKPVQKEVAENTSDQELGQNLDEFVVNSIRALDVTGTRIDPVKLETLYMGAR